MSEVMGQMIIWFKILLTVVFYFQILSVFKEDIKRRREETPKVVTILFFTAIIAGIWLVL